MPGRAKAAESASPDSRFFSGIRWFPERSEATAERSRIPAALNTCYLDRSEALAERSRRTPGQLAAPPACGEFPPPAHRTELPATKSAETSRQGSLRRTMYSWLGSRWSATRRNHMEGRASPPDVRVRGPSTSKTRHSQAQSAPPPIRSSGAAFRSPDTWSLQTGSRSRDKRPRSRRYQWAARTDRTSSSSQAAGLCDNLDKQNLHGAAPSRVLRARGHAAVLPSNSEA